MRTMIVMLALAGASTAALAEATVCRGKSGAYLSECGTCPPGMHISGPNKANGKQCEGDPTVPAGPVSRSDHDNAARKDYASSRPASATASGYQGGYGASSPMAQESYAGRLKERKARKYPAGRAYTFDGATLAPAPAAAPAAAPAPAPSATWGR